MQTRMAHNPNTEATCCVECDSARNDRVEIARHLYRAMCEQYPDRMFILCDGDGRVLETSFVRSKILSEE